MSSSISSSSEQNREMIYNSIQLVNSRRRHDKRRNYEKGRGRWDGYRERRGREARGGRANGGEAAEQSAQVSGNRSRWWSRGDGPGSWRVPDGRRPQRRLSSRRPAGSRRWRQCDGEERVDGEDGWRCGSSSSPRNRDRSGWKARYCSLTRGDSLDFGCKNLYHFCLYPVISV